jgi:hypothetical protein
MRIMVAGSALTGHVNLEGEAERDTGGNATTWKYEGEKLEQTSRLGLVQARRFRVG